MKARRVLVRQFTWPSSTPGQHVEEMVVAGIVRSCIRLFALLDQ